ncbi:MAG: 30S ribosomal protein S4 [Candidatus Omnitrophica bacterium]|jgi:small subunit ribosomal protein S4|nr:30S ribosomal protein S4 [Candidatus Omnitrophota bacterium]
MARYTEAVCRLCRRSSEKLFLKGNKCFSEKCTLTKRAFPPGDHGQNRLKLSNYGTQMKEKQKVKWMYGMMEGQFRRYFQIASHTKGVTGRVLLQLLERRLDNVIFRLGLASSRPQARQVVRHNAVYVNSKRVNIPSYLVEQDDVIEIKVKEGFQKGIKDTLELNKNRSVPTWLDFDASSLKAKVNRLPEKNDIPATIQEQLIVELYSK